MKFQEDLPELSSFSFSQELCSTIYSQGHKIKSSDSVESRASYKQQPQAPRRLRAKQAPHTVPSSCSSTSAASVVSFCSSESTDVYSTSSSLISSSPAFTPKSLLIMKRKASNDTYVCSFCISRKTRQTTFFKEIAGFNSFSSHMIDFHSTLVLITGTNTKTTSTSAAQKVTWSKATDSILKIKLERPLPDYDNETFSSFPTLPSQDANTQTEDEEEVDNNLKLSTIIIDDQLKGIPPDIDEWFQNVEIPDAKEYKDVSIQTDPTVCHCGAPYSQFAPSFPFAIPAIPKI